MEQVIHVKVPEEWYKGLRALANDAEGTINQQTRLAIRERLERKGILDETRGAAPAIQKIGQEAERGAEEP